MSNTFSSTIFEENWVIVNGLSCHYYSTGCPKGVLAKCLRPLDDKNTTFAPVYYKIE